MTDRPWRCLGPPQDTTIKLGVDKVESYTELQPSAQSSKSLVLGPYKDVPGGKG
jgi:hypothetical protein